MTHQPMLPLFEDHFEETCAILRDVAPGYADALIRELTSEHPTEAFTIDPPGAAQELARRVVALGDAPTLSDFIVRACSNDHVSFALNEALRPALHPESIVAAGVTYEDLSPAAADLYFKSSFSAYEHARHRSASSSS